MTITFNKKNATIKRELRSSSFLPKRRARGGHAAENIKTGVRCYTRPFPPINREIWQPYSVKLNFWLIQPKRSDIKFILQKQEFERISHYRPIITN